MPTVLYLRGEPGSGKKTVADILNRDRQWALCWLHSLDDVYRIIGHHPPPAVMDAILRPVVNYLMWKKRDILFVRPARTRQSVESVAEAAKCLGYKFICIRLTANYDTLLDRVCQREPNDFRVYDGEGLDNYLNARPLEEFPGEHTVNTDKLTPEDAAAQIRKLIGA